MDLFGVWIGGVMRRPPDLSENAPWKRRYRAWSVAWARVARGNPARGLACTDRDGVQQLYAWDEPTGNLRQITDRPAGVGGGMILVDGKYVYYHLDAAGDETGHLVRIPYTGGDAEDVTPGLPSCSRPSIKLTQQGNPRLLRK
jgi:hypothetical protein